MTALPYQTLLRRREGRPQRHRAVLRCWAVVVGQLCGLGRILGLRRGRLDQRVPRAAQPLERVRRRGVGRRAAALATTAAQRTHRILGIFGCAVVHADHSSNVSQCTAVHGMDRECAQRTDAAVRGRSTAGQNSLLALSILALKSQPGNLTKYAPGRRRNEPVARPFPTVPPARAP